MDDAESDKQTAFERFEQLTKRIVETPKERIAAARKKTKRRIRSSRKNRQDPI